MDLRNCKRCGMIFTYQDSVYCNTCRKLDDDDFKRVKEYLYENPKASMLQVSKDTNVSAERIRRYLKDGRLEIIGNEENGVLFCELCKKNISTGRYCEECGRKIGKGLKLAANSLATKEVESKKQDPRKQDPRKKEPATGGYKFINKDRR